MSDTNPCQLDRKKPELIYPLGGIVYFLRDPWKIIDSRKFHQNSGCAVVDKDLFGTFLIINWILLKCLL